MLKISVGLSCLLHVLWLPVPSVHLTEVVVVEEEATSLYMSVFPLFSWLTNIIFLLRLRLLLIAPFIFNNTLSHTHTKKKLMWGNCYIITECILKIYRLYISWQEFDGYAQDEHGPEDVQSQQHKQQPVEEAEAEEGPDDAQRVHERRVYDPGADRNKEPTQNHRSTTRSHRPDNQFVNHKIKSLESLEHICRIHTCSYRTLVCLIYLFFYKKIQLCCIDELNFVHVSRKASLSFRIN